MRAAQIEPPGNLPVPSGNDRPRQDVVEIVLGDVVIFVGGDVPTLRLLEIVRVRTHIAKGLTAPAYKPRLPQPHLIDPFAPYLRERLAAFPTLTGRRLWRELRERGYRGGYTAVTDFLRDLRPPRTTGFEVRFETPPGVQAQVDFAQFVVEFTDAPGVRRIVWLFSMVFGYSRLIWARFVLHQDLQTVLRCHVAAFEAIGRTRQIGSTP